MKKQFLAFLTAVSLCAATAFTLTACSKNEREQGTTQETKDPKLTLNKTTLSLELATSETLTATLENSTENVVWSSSDPTVATVENGRVSALKTGTTVITATAGDVSDQCTVTVTAFATAPTFVALEDEISIIKGTTETLDTTLKIGDAEFTQATFTFTTEGDKLTVSTDGVITANEYGTQTVKVKAFYGATEIASAEIEVEVIEYVEINTGLSDNAVALTVTNHNGETETEFDLSVLTVAVNGETVTAPDFAIESDKTGVAKVENGKIVAVGKGTAAVTVSYTTTQGTYDTVINVTVSKELVKTDVNFFLKGTGSATDDTRKTGTVSVDMTGKGVELDKVVKVVCGENEVEKAIDGNTLTLTNAPEGEQIYVLETETCDYEIKGLIYTKAIESKADFLDYYKNFNGIYGYTVLLTDIDLDGAQLDVAGGWLRGTFDGRGHTISNFITKKGFIVSYNDLGTVKNLQLINVVKDCSEDRGERFGLFGHEVCGTIENVVVYARFIGMDQRENNADRQNLLFGCTFTTTVKNVVAVVDVEDYAGTLYGIGHEYVGGESTVENVYIVCNKPVAQVEPANCKVNVSASDTTVDGILDVIPEDAFDGWTKEEGELPFMSDYESVLNAPVAKLIGEAERGSTMEVQTTVAVGAPTVALKEAVTGVSVNGTQVVFANDAALGQEITIVVTCATIEGWQKEFKVTLYGNQAINYSKDYVKAESNTVTLATSEFDAFPATVEKLYVNNTEVTGYTFEDGTFTFSTSARGTVKVKFLVSGTYYTTEVLVVDRVLANKADVVSYFGSFPSGYTVLTADVDMGGDTLVSSDGWLVPKFDGLGHTISNFVSTKGINPACSDQVNAFIKNVQFVNMVMNLDGGASIGLFGEYCCDFENVLVIAKFMNAKDGQSLITGMGMTVMDFKNVVVQVEFVDFAGTAYAFGGSWQQGGDNDHATFENVYIVSNVTLSATGASYIPTGTQIAVADITTENVTLSDMWTVEADKLPYMSAYTTEE